MGKIVTEFIFLFCILGLCLAGNYVEPGNGRKNKPQRCPQLIDKLLRADCPSECGGDSDCPLEQKCCENDCGGLTCLNPVPEETGFSKCDIPCPRLYAPVCGRDGVTYSTECILRYEACKRNQNWLTHGSKLYLHDGPCTDEDTGLPYGKYGGNEVHPEEEVGPCYKELSKLMQKPRLIGAQQPQCDKDGFYLPMQCWASTGMCWCSDRFGHKLMEPVRGRLEGCEEMAKDLP